MREASSGRALAAFVLAVLVGACGDDSVLGAGGGGGGDATSAATTGAGTTSASTSAAGTTASTTTTATTTTGSSTSSGTGGAGSGGAPGAGGQGPGSGGAGGAAPLCELDGLDVVDDFAGLTSDQGLLVYNGSSLDGAEVLVVELWFQYGAGVTPHTFTFTGENYLDCNNCAVLLTDCVDGDCARRFLVESGTLDVTELDLETGIFTASLDGAVAVESTIDPETAVSTAVPGGERWCLDHVDLQVTGFMDLPFTLTKP